MSKRTIILAVLAVVLFAAALFSTVLDFKPVKEQEPDQEPEPEIITEEKEVVSDLKVENNGTDTATNKEV
jgi:flagellar basal body-associated protein FliL